ncbi:MAG: tryptophan synthase subunit alpha [Candidatus Eisenbacteria bacterium]|nr:tryptophan synthase subunit alpha [Candidatus Latescibacterota bacterium]MBD3301544.1 tryptophan synthase subunit alpha [Candidatus Eisenbacteria bacterium]
MRPGALQPRRDPSRGEARGGAGQPPTGDGSRTREQRHPLLPRGPLLQEGDVRDGGPPPARLPGAGTRQPADPLRSRDGAEQERPPRRGDRNAHAALRAGAEERRCALQSRHRARQERPLRPGESGVPAGRSADAGLNDVESRLEGAILQRRKKGGRALVPFLTAGYPDRDRFLAALEAAARAGADAIEIGVPFSDPLADGPTIQRTSQRALDQGITLERILDLLEEQRDAIAPPIVLMTYANPILRFGAERFCDRAVRAGIAGILVSDLPPEELPELGRLLSDRGIDRVLLVAPTTRPERAAALARAARGFLYLVTRTGVTGAGGSFSSRLEEQVRTIRSAVSLPILAGFGIRRPEDVDALRDLVDGVVIGARLLEAIEGAGDPAAVDRAVGGFLGPIREALDRG